MDTTTGYMHAWGKRLGKCLLDIPKHVRDVVEYGVHRGAIVALVAAQVRSSHELHYLVGFPEGEGVTNHERLIKDFAEAANAVATEVPTEEVILEALEFVLRAFLLLIKTVYFCLLLFMRLSNLHVSNDVCRSRTLNSQIGGVLSRY
jgi:hypothetical protein